MGLLRRSEVAVKRSARGVSRGTVCLSPLLGLVLPLIAQRFLHQGHGNVDATN
jgi:hypothetical protein